MKKKAQTNSKEVPVKTLGLPAELQSDLAVLGIYTLYDLMIALETTDGFFTRLTDPTRHVFITPEESVKLYETVMQHPAVSSTWKEVYEERPSEAPMDWKPGAVAVQEKPVASEAAVSRPVFADLARGFLGKK